MTTANERLVILRKKLGLSTTALAETIGYSQSMISYAENHPQKPLEKRLVRALHLAFGVNEEWLLTGKGGDSAVFDPKPIVEEEALIAFLRDCIDQLSNENRQILMSVIKELAVGEKSEPTPKKPAKKKGAKK